MTLNDNLDKKIKMGQGGLQVLQYFSILGSPSSTQAMLLKWKAEKTQETLGFVAKEDLKRNAEFLEILF